MNELIEKFKGIPKWGWVAIAGGILLAIFLGTRNRMTTVPQVSSAADGTRNGAGITTGITNEQLIAYQRNLESQVKEGYVASLEQIGKILDQQEAEYDQKIADQKKATEAILANQNAVIGAVSGSFNSKVNELTSLVKEQNESVKNQNAAVLDFVFKMQTAPKTSPVASPVYQPVNVPSYSDDDTPYIGGRQGVTAYTVGNGGADYNTASYEVKKSIEENERKLATDSSFVASEKVRTDSVIAYRQSQGLDVSEQLAYKSKLAAM